MSSHQPLSRWSTTSLYLLLFSLSRCVLVNSQYVPPQALAYRRSYVNGKLSGRGQEAKGNSTSPQGEATASKDGSGDATSQSKELWLKSHDDFCVYGLGEENKGKMISESVDNVISYCSKSGHNTRLIPDGTLKGVTYVRTPSWVQVSGSGDFSLIGISPGDTGAQFDSSAHTPQGASLITSIGGDPAKDWVTMISGQTFCVRACFGDSSFCPTQYDSLGCYFLTSNGVGWDNVYQDCEGDDGDPPGVIDGQTYTPGNGPVPTPSIPAVSNCQPGSSIQNGQTAAAGSKNASASGSGGGSTSWVPVQTCVPCTATASGSGSGSSAPSASAPASSSDAPKEGGGGSDQSGAASVSSSSGNPFAEGGSAGSTSAASAAASGSKSEGTSAAEGGTEQVGVTKLSPSSATASSGESEAAITPAPAPASGDLSARGLDQWLNLRRGEGEGEGGRETVTSGEQCCFTTWTPSIVGATAKPTGTAAAGNGTGVGKNGTSSGSGSKSGAKGSLTGTNTAGTSATASGKNGNGTAGHNGTNANGTNSSESYGSSLYRDNLYVGVGRLAGLVFAVGVGMALGGLTLV
ncbi:hypothetical protein I302_108055 [Kwoniella bestiolae CBS 10118]|uniref:Uncharacterized protein n=1 Tax=Kwoniella bestiolae CBS 10118 TaxID=1296100 RepID=A0A1B9FWS2_9TREE|nr:hypothetical protein I302_07579 [Kwoniella bestiolae CBS 10118]OCF23225.1 hypothetical protein I302_07579 [Kwoniella bestiolae CBS 10118]